MVHQLGRLVSQAGLRGRSEQPSQCLEGVRQAVRAVMRVVALVKETLRMGSSDNLGACSCGTDRVTVTQQKREVVAIQLDQAEQEAGGGAGQV